MSLPARLYNTFRKIQKSALVTKSVYTDADITEFVELLNSAHPADETELIQYKFARCMFNSHKESYIKYITNQESNVSALILWTESKVIVRFFGIQQKIYLGWDDENKTYIFKKFDETKRKAFEFKSGVKKPYNIPHKPRSYKTQEAPRMIMANPIKEKITAEMIDENINALQAKFDKLKQTMFPVQTIELEVKYAEPAVKPPAVNAALVSMRKKNKSKAAKDTAKNATKVADTDLTSAVLDSIINPKEDSSEREFNSNLPTPTVPIPSESVAE
jgi:hypothetical protein